MPARFFDGRLGACARVSYFTVRLFEMGDVICCRTSEARRDITFLDYGRQPRSQMGFTLHVAPFPTLMRVMP